jgi:hypothetical protein
MGRLPFVLDCATDSDISNILDICDILESVSCLFSMPHKGSIPTRASNISGTSTLD